MSLLDQSQMQIYMCRLQIIKFQIQDYQQYSLLHETLFEDQAEDVCSLASAIGPCRAAVPRFFFNGDSGWFFLSD